ncbi:hypothetical protein K437DRAFT_267908 [Tilletiaria anomala UBC 951]|uniref:RRN7-type domain-containing protein n=1 Tax=Tilletiaria anomala (strain ATCC 24038 / CBS 436.72 / UBC 951) TaxID=1037660 RepID=A0A066W054_TILAU|nr:uncharacterized protein K437DRAFT_267908 [Tilletiaria anomala UBC 951]KDN47131.1 hypothetical protein K437DRAFT_267908 [Tilletiaria anomala UBC 951]
MDPYAHPSPQPPRRMRPRCPQCGSRRFRRDAVSGLVVCQDGHVLQGFRDELADDEDGAAERASTRIRYRRKGRSNRSAEKRRAAALQQPKQIYGLHAAFRGYQCLQLMLRLQLDALRTLFPRLPHAQLEAAAREYWTLFLYIIENDDAPEPARYRLSAMPVADPVSPPLSPHPHHVDDGYGDDDGHSAYSFASSTRYTSHGAETDRSSQHSPSSSRRSHGRSRSRSRSRSAIEATLAALHARQKQRLESQNQRQQQSSIAPDTDDDVDLHPDSDLESQARSDVSARRRKPAHLQGRARAPRRVSVFTGFRRPPAKSDAASNSEETDSSVDQGATTDGASSKHGGYSSRGFASSSSYSIEAETTNSERSRRRSSNKKRSSGRARGGHPLGEYASIAKRSALLDNTLCILYLSLWTLRIPLHLGDLRRLLLARRLPYLDAQQHLPRALVHQLNASAVRHFGLDAARVPPSEALYAAVRGFARQIAAVTNIRLPPLNVAPVLWSCTRRMLLPPSVYVAAKALLIFCDFLPHLSVEFARAAALLDRSNAAAEAKENVGSNGENNMDAAGSAAETRWNAPLVKSTLSKKTWAMPREVLLVAAIVVVLKMRYGLDGRKRYEHQDGPSAGMPKLNVWLRAMQEVTAAMEADPSAAYNPSCDVLDMSEEQLDAFLDHAEDTLVLKNEAVMHRARNANETQSFLKFTSPASSRTSDPSSTAARELQAREEHLQRAMASLYDSPHSVPASASLSSSLGADGRLKCGQAYRAYVMPVPHEDDGQLPEELQLVLEIGADVAGCEVETLNRALVAIESALRSKVCKKPASITRGNAFPA